MNIKKDIAIREFIKQLTVRDFVYPGTIIVFLIITLILFFQTTQFISKNIDRIFISDVTSDTQALNLSRYKLIAKKLNIEVPTTSEQVSIPNTPPVATRATTTIDKHALTITIKNSTQKTGVATALAKTLETAGFSKPTIGNESVRYATTTIFIKESASLYEAMLLEVVRKTYPSTVATTTPEGAATDATIIIGTK